MTAFSTAYDSIIKVIEETLPNHVELIDAYRPEINDDLTYQAAFGVVIGDGENTNREFNRKTSRRIFSIVLTRKIFKGDASRSSFSVSEKRATEKALFEDLSLLVSAIETNQSLNNTSGDLGFCLYRTDSGLEQIRTDRVDLIMTRAVFEIEYLEEL